MPAPVEQAYTSPDGAYRLEVRTTLPGRLGRQLGGGPGDACMHGATVTLLSAEGRNIRSARMSDSCLIGERAPTWEADAVSFRYADGDLMSVTWTLP